MATQPTDRGADGGADLLVGLDVGGSYVKATAVHPERGVVATRGRPAPPSHPRPGHNERDAESTWLVVTEVLAELMSVLGRPPSVAAMGVTGHGNGLYLLDDRGAPTRQAIMASDTRAGPLVQGWRASGLVEELRPSTWNGIWPGQPGPLLAWLAEHEPQVLQRSTHAVLCSDFVRGRLTGGVQAELTGISCSGLFDHDVERVGPRVLGALGIEHLAGLVPEPVVSSAPVGEVLPSVAARCAVPAGTPLVAGLVDNVALHLGSGVHDDRTLCLSAGTWSVNQLLTARSALAGVDRLSVHAPFAACLAHEAGTALLIDASPTSASVLAWALDTAFAGLDDEVHGGGEERYALALGLVEHGALDVDGPYFLPFLDGTRDDSSARGAWLNLSSWNDRGSLVAAVVEGICMEHRRHLDRLDPSGSLPVRMTGGAARSRVWAQVFADVTGRRFEVPAHEEVGAVGVAVHAGVALGLLADWSAAAPVLQARRSAFEPGPAAAVRQRRFERYCSLVERLLGGDAARNAQSTDP